MFRLALLLLLLAAPVFADPTLVFKHTVDRYRPMSVAVDPQGNAILGGLGFTNNISDRVIVEKWNPSGERLLATTTVRASAGLTLAAISSDASGVYLIGSSSSSDFPATANAFQKTPVGTDNGYIAKLSPESLEIVYATFLRGANPTAIAIGPDGAAYLTGSTRGSLPVTRDAFQTESISNCAPSPQLNALRGGDAFVAKLSPDGSALVYASYLGGSCGEYGTAISLNANGSVWLAGVTASFEFPTTSDALQRSRGFGFDDGFLARISAAGDRIEYATFLGGSDYDEISAMARDAQGNLYLTGSSGGFFQPASPDAYQSVVNGCTPVPPIINPGTLNLFRYDGFGFVMKLDPTGKSISAFTYLGSACNSFGTAISLDSKGAPWVASTGYSSFPLATPFAVDNNATNFLSKLSPDLTQLLFSSSLDISTGFALDRSDAAYVIGRNPNATKAEVGTGFFAKITLTDNPVSLDDVKSASPFADLLNTERIAPGKVIRLRGRNLGPKEMTLGTVDNNAIESEVHGVRVTFDDIPAPLLYISSTEIECLVPFALADRTSTKIQVTANGVASNMLTAPVQAQAPEVLGLFNEDFTPNSAENPAPRGSVAILFLTGAGQTSPPTVDGQVYTSPVPEPLSKFEIFFPTHAAITPILAGPRPGLAAGIFQIYFRIPDDLVVPYEFLSVGSTNQFKLWTK